MHTHGIKFWLVNGFSVIGLTGAGAEPRAQGPGPTRAAGVNPLAVREYDSTAHKPAVLSAFPCHIHVCAQTGEGRYVSPWGDLLGQSATSSGHTCLFAGGTTSLGHAWAWL